MPGIFDRDINLLQYSYEGFSEWEETTRNSDLIVISFGSGNNGDGDASQQREPEFVKEARKGSKNVSVLNVDQFKNTIVPNGQSTCYYLYQYLNLENISKHPHYQKANKKNINKFRNFIRTSLSEKPVVLADYISGNEGFKRLKLLLGPALCNHPNLTLICGYTVRHPILISQNGSNIPDGMKLDDLNAEEYIISDVERLNPNARAFLKLENVTLNDLHVQKSSIYQAFNISSSLLMGLFAAAAIASLLLIIAALFTPLSPIIPLSVAIGFSATAIPVSIGLGIFSLSKKVIKNIEKEESLETTTQYTT